MGSIFKHIKALISFIVIVAIFLAILWQFNFDFFAAVSWFVNFVIDMILKLANLIANMPFFRGIFQR